MNEKEVDGIISVMENQALAMENHICELIKLINECKEVNNEILKQYDKESIKQIRNKNRNSEVLQRVDEKLDELYEILEG